MGTSAHCNSDGSSSHHAWYELVPAAPVQLTMPISAGDRMSGRVQVNGTAVTVSLANRTTGASFTRTIQMEAPDTTTAEWIAEAPSSCDTSGGCQTLPLSDFGTVTFTNASATSGDHTGTISDAAWTAQPIQLNAAGGYPQAGFVSTGASGGATPSSLSSGGSSFSVSTGSGNQPAASAGPSGDAPSGDGSVPVIVWIYG